MRVLVPILAVACAPSGADDVVVDDTVDSGDVEDSQPPAVDSGDDSAGDTGPPPVPATWTVGEAVACAQPGLRTTVGPFERLDPGGAWATMVVTTDTPPLFAGGGVSVLDVDDDGVLDLFRTHDDGGTAWFALAAGGAVDRTSALPDLPHATSMILPVDIDGDGVLELHVTAWGGPDRVYRRTVDGWTDVAADLGLAGPSDELTAGASWADADGDGDLDAFVAAHGEILEDGPLPLGQPSRLLIQRDDGTFDDLVPQLGAKHPLKEAHTFQGAWLPFVPGAAPVLYVVQDFGWRFPNGAYRVQGGVLSTLAPAGYEARGTNMGLGVGDLNGDGDLDLVVPEIDRLQLYLSQPLGWFEGSLAVGLVPDGDDDQQVGWGAELADLDHDGDLDAFVAFGQLDVSARIRENPSEQPDGLWIQANGTFSDRAASWGVDDGTIGRGFVVVDLNGDGWLDLVRHDLHGPVLVDRARCGDGAWLVVEPRQPETRNPFAVGTVVRAEIGDRTVSGFVHAGGTSYLSAGPYEVHLGLGDVDVVDRVVVTWPDGREDVREDVPTRRRLEVRRP